VKVTLAPGAEGFGEELSETVADACVMVTVSALDTGLCAYLLPSPLYCAVTWSFPAGRMALLSVAFPAESTETGEPKGLPLTKNWTVPTAFGLPPRDGVELIVATSVEVVP
jgi:hypothetical protein